MLHGHAGACSGINTVPPGHCPLLGPCYIFGGYAALRSVTRQGFRQQCTVLIFRFHQQIL